MFDEIVTPALARKLAREAKKYRPNPPIHSDPVLDGITDRIFAYKPSSKKKRKAKKRRG